MDHQINVTRIKAVYNALGELKNKVVFVGGATISLYADAGAFAIRPTEDVDVVVEVWGYAGYADLNDKLIQYGFRNVAEAGAPVVRYKIKGIVVDVLPTDSSMFGFNSKWYPEGFTNAVPCKIDKEHIVKILTPVFFLATKLEAFKDRGQNDGRTSKDFEDIVFILENRRAIWEELTQTSGELRTYLVAEFRKWMKNRSFEEWVDCHVEPGSPRATYSIMEELTKLTA
jgi:hypothetical protein